MVPEVYEGKDELQKKIAELQIQNEQMKVTTNGYQLDEMNKLIK